MIRSLTWAGRRSPSRGTSRTSHPPGRSWRWPRPWSTGRWASPEQIKQFNRCVVKSNTKICLVCNYFKECKTVCTISFKYKSSPYFSFLLWRSCLKKERICILLWCNLTKLSTFCMTNYRFAIEDYVNLNVFKLRSGKI